MGTHALILALVGIIWIQSTQAVLLLKDYKIESGRKSISLQQESSFSECEEFATRRRFLFASFNYHFESRKCELIAKSEACSLTGLVRAPGWEMRVLTDFCDVPESAFLQGQEEIARETSCTSGVLGFTIGFGEGMPSGSIQSTGIDSCLQVCLSTANCQGVTLFQSNICIIQTSTSSVVSTAGTVYFRRVCLRNLTATVVPVPTRPPTVAPPSVLTIVGDSGWCPDRFQTFAMSSLLGGTVILNMTTADACKLACLADATCLAVDFNSDVVTCFRHTTLTGVFTQGTVGGVTHFRKISCMLGRCYNQLVVNNAVPGTDVQNILNPTTLTVTESSCGSGLCFTEYTFDATSLTALTESIGRGCTSSDNGPTLGCTSATSGSVTTTRCVCSGDRCNSFSTVLQAERLGYYPLDKSGLDLSGYTRHAQAVNITYDQTDAKRNYTAVFDGTAYLQVNTFTQIQIGQIGDNTGFSDDTAAGFAVAMWIKTDPPSWSPTGTVSGDSTILSNGAPGSAPVEILSSVVSNVQTITAHLRVRNVAANMDFNITGSITGLAVSTWYFVVIQLNANPGTTTTTLDMNLYAGTTSLTEIQTTTAPTIVPNVNTPVRVTFAPLCIGKQFASIDPVQPGLPSLFFKGRIDDIWLFNRGNMAVTSYQSIMDQSK